MKKILFALSFVALSLWGNAHLSHRGTQVVAPHTEHPDSLAESDSLVWEPDSAEQQDSLPIQSLFEATFTPINQKTAFQLDKMPYFYGAYEMEVVKNGITSCHYNLFLGQRVYTIYPIDEAIEQMEREKQGLPAITAERASMKSIDPEELFDLLVLSGDPNNWNVTAEIMDDDIVDFLRNDFFPQLYDQDTLSGPSAERHLDLETLGVDDPNRQLPYLFGVNIMRYVFENGQTAIQSLGWKGREYDQFSTIPLEEFGSNYVINAHLQPCAYLMTDWPEGELRTTRKIGFAAFYDALTITFRNIYLERRWKEETSRLPDGFYATMNDEVQAVLDSVAQLRKPSPVRGASVRSKASKAAAAAPSLLDTPARYVQGERAMLTFLANRVRYPKQSVADNVQGTVKVRFAVEPDGTITGVHVARSLDEYCDLEAINAVNCLPNLVPAFKKGRPVRSWMDVPVKFTIRE